MKVGTRERGNEERWDKEEGRKGRRGGKEKERNKKEEGVGEGVWESGHGGKGVRERR